MGIIGISIVRNTDTVFYSCNAGTVTGGTSFVSAWHKKAGGTSGITYGAVGTTTYVNINKPYDIWDYNARAAWKKQRNKAGGYKVPYPSYRGPTLSFFSYWTSVYSF